MKQADMQTGLFKTSLNIATLLSAERGATIVMPDQDTQDKARQTSPPFRAPLFAARTLFNATGQVRVTLIAAATATAL